MSSPTTPSATFVDVVSHDGIRLKKTRPFRPQTNGKAEAFIKTLQREWAYRRPYTSNRERIQALETFLVDLQLLPSSHCDRQPASGRSPVNNGHGK